MAAAALSRVRPFLAARDEPGRGLAWLRGGAPPSRGDVSVRVAGPGTRAGQISGTSERYECAASMKSGKGPVTEEERAAALVKADAHLSTQPVEGNVEASRPTFR